MLRQRANLVPILSPNNSPRFADPDWSFNDDMAVALEW